MSDLRIFEKMVAGNPDRMSFVDAHYIYREVNYTYLADFQCRREEIVGQPISKILGQASFELIKAHFDACLSGTPVRYQDWFDFPTADRRFMDVIYNPYRDADGKITGVVVTARDYTEQRRAAEALAESQARLDLIASTLEDVVWFTDLGVRKVLFASKAYEHIWGRPVQGLYENPLDWMQAIHPEDRPRIEQIDALIRSTGQFNVEYRVVRPDGSVRWIHDRGFAVSGASGNSHQFAGIAQDITRRRELEQALSLQQQRLRAFLDNSSVFAWMKDEAGRYVFLSDNFQQKLRIEAADWEGKTDLEMLPRAIAEQYRRNDARALQENKAIEMIERGFDEDGSPTYWLCNKFPFQDGEMRYVGGLAVDVTERVRLQELLQSERKQLRSFLNNTLVAAWMKDEDGRYVFVNDKLLQRFKSCPEDWLGKTDLEIWPGEAAEQLRRNDLAVLESGQAIEILEKAVSPNGDVSWWVSNKFLFQDENGTCCVGGLGVDVTARVRADEERQKFFLLAERSHEFIGMCDCDFVPFYVNPAGCHLVGLENLEAACSVNVWDYFFPEDQAFIREEFFPRIQREGRGELEIRFRHFKTGEAIWMMYNVFRLDDAQGATTGWATVSLNITDRKRAEQSRRLLEERLAHSQKLEAVGKLASGMAHDVNSLLMVVLGSAEIIRTQLAKAGNMDVQRSKEAVERLMDAVDRGKGLLDKLLTFGRVRTGKPTPVVLNTVVTDTLKLIKSAVEMNIRVNISLDPDLWRCAADAAQLLQVIMNLVMNASDAMPEGGILTVATANIVLSPQYAAAHAEAQSGPHVVLTVSDTGIGMDKQTLERIIEPYFTTKPVDKGSGLGLAIVHGIVKQAGGHFTVTSVLGKETDMRVYFPAIF